MNNDENIRKLNEFFGSYRAEWLKDKIFQLFEKPSYFHELQSARPCVLQGGRGTGKTTALKGLSYQGQFAFHNNDVYSFDKNVSFIGLYHKIDTNHVRAFKGPAVSEDKWHKIFSHYFNLIICYEILLFVQWHRNLNLEDQCLDKDDCCKVAKSLCITDVDDIDNEKIITFVENEIYDFQSAINNISDDCDSLKCSISGAPIKLLTQKVCGLRQFYGKTFYILLDEYENFEDYQQIIVNSLVKHSSENYIFKIGVRELGWRKKYTLNKHELLLDPADYVFLHIEKLLTSNSDFENFAQAVCQQRISALLKENVAEIFDIKQSLPQLDYEKEAIMLGIDKSDYIQELRVLCNTGELIDDVLNLPMLYQFVIVHWSHTQNLSLKEVIADYRKNQTKWDQRYSNYKYDMLFKIRQGRGSAGITKYYTGWNTFVKLASGNIRYLMELIYRVYERHLSEQKNILEPVDYKIQTEVAMAIGKKNLIQLESFCKEGAHLIKLLHGMGKVFSTLARDLSPHAAEINQFTIENSRELSSYTENLMSVAVMNLAFVREFGTKLGETETKDYSYSIHPIYAPFFVFSFRKKRKMIVSEQEIRGLIDNPKQYIKSMLAKRNVVIDPPSTVSDQPELFGDVL